MLLLVFLLLLFVTALDYFPLSRGSIKNNFSIFEEGKVYVYSTLPKLTLWDFTGYGVVVYNVGKWTFN